MRFPAFFRAWFPALAAAWSAVSAAADGSPPSTPPLPPFRQTFQADHRWLCVPVKNGAPLRKVELWVDGVRRCGFNVELADAGADWTAYGDLSAWRGKTVELRVNQLPPGSQAFAPVRQADSQADPGPGPLYGEPLRPQFHFTADRGWLNDPNGLIYSRGEYHLFFQYNPYGTVHQNMHWGHAVSTDLVHWKQLDIALFPDRFGPMDSGSAICDARNTSGLGGGTAAPLVLLYTAGGTPTVQGLAWSLDGRHFQKRAEPVLAEITHGNRDPKVFWHEPSGKWVMALYVQQPGEVHTVRFFSSPDLQAWTPTGEIRGGTGKDHFLYECPNLVDLPVEGRPGERKWVLSGASAEYQVGAFDGRNFTPESPRLPGKFGGAYYAAQVFNDEPKGRRIEIGWWRTPFPGMPFNQAMSLPVELKLVETADGLRLTRTPVEELASLRKEAHHLGPLALREGGIDPLDGLGSDLVEVRAAFKPEPGSMLTLTVRGVPMVYDAGKGTLTVGKTVAPLPPGKEGQDLIVYADRGGLEIFGGNGLVYLPVATPFVAGSRPLALSVQGGAVRFANLDVYDLDSIWK